MRRVVLYRIVLSVMFVIAGWTGGAAGAADLAREFPAGSILSVEEVHRALHAARAEAKRAEDEYTLQKERCTKDFFTNACEDRARRERNRARAEVQRVELEARDRQRALDAQTRNQRKERGRPASDVAATEIESENYAAPRQEKAVPAEQRRVAEVKHRARDRVRFEAKQTEYAQREAERHAPRAVEQREASAKAFAEKRAQAQEHAEAKAKQKEDNERRRAERKKQRDEEVAKQKGR